MSRPAVLSLFFFFNDTATTEIYTLSLHDALPILMADSAAATVRMKNTNTCPERCSCSSSRSEEHTSELQSLTNLVCRLLLEKKIPDAYVAIRATHDDAVGAEPEPLALLRAVVDEA